MVITEITVSCARAKSEMSRNMTEAPEDYTDCERYADVIYICYVSCKRVLCKPDCRTSGNVRRGSIQLHRIGDDCR